MFKKKNLKPLDPLGRVHTTPVLYKQKDIQKANLIQNIRLQLTKPTYPTPKTTQKKLKKLDPILTNLDKQLDGEIEC